jgi:hypothetical protein
VPEISIKRGATLLIPLELRNHTSDTKNISISLKLPDGWTNQSGVGNLTLEPQSDFYWQVTVDAPKAEAKAREEIECKIETDGKTLNTIKLSVRLVNGGLPQN